LELSAALVGSCVGRVAKVVIFKSVMNAP
jgi:hypothetical protein